MRFRVTFAERTNSAGVPTEKAPEYLETNLPDGVVLDKAFVEQDEPLGMHGADSMDEEDTFLSVGTEIWDYNVADGREQDFVDAARRSHAVVECVPLETSSLEDVEEV